MATQHSTATVDIRSAARSAIKRDSQGLLEALAAIDDDGWDGERATALLTYIRSEMVRPLTIDSGLRGRASFEAEATAWEAVWLKLRDPSLRAAKSPWGVIWQTARRAALGEALAARWGSGGRRAWTFDVDERAGYFARPIPLEPLLDNGEDFALPASTGASDEPTPISSALDLAAGALADAGWPAAMAVEIVGEVAIIEAPLAEGRTVVGWRPLAARLGIPPWQARRLTFVLRGSAERRGLLGRLVAEGSAVLDAPEVRQALANTLVRTSPTPTRRPAAPGPSAPSTEAPERPLSTGGRSAAHPPRLSGAHLTP